AKGPGVLHPEPSAPLATARCCRAVPAACPDGTRQPPPAPTVGQRSSPPLGPLDEPRPVYPYLDRPTSPSHRRPPPGARPTIQRGRGRPKPVDRITRRDTLTGSGRPIVRASLG